MKCLNQWSWYGTSVDIYVDKSTLWSKYFHRFKILQNLTKKYVWKFVLKWKILLLLGPAGFELMIYRYVALTEIHYTALLGYNFRDKQLWCYNLDLMVDLLAMAPLIINKHVIFDEREANTTTCNTLYVHCVLFFLLKFWTPTVSWYWYLIWCTG